jgi:hypothetical protein
MTTDHDEYTATSWGRLSIEVVRYPGRSPWELATYCVQIWDGAITYGTPVAEEWDGDPNVAAAGALRKLDLSNLGDDLDD